VLVDRRNLSDHLAWIAVFALGTVAAVVWYVVYASTDGLERWPGGSSAPGLVFGIVGGAIMVFEFLLWPKKKLRRYRLGKAQIWMRAHIWLGLLTVPLISLHAGIDWGAPLTSVLMILFWIVIISGVVGLILQNVLPRLLLAEVREETVFSQIDHVAAQLVGEAEGAVLVSCGDWETRREPRSVNGGTKVVGAPRTVLPREIPLVVLSRKGERERLRQQFYEEIRPYLDRGRKSGGRLRHASWAESYFAGLRESLEQGAHPLVESLEESCDTRRQLDRQARVHGWLHGWLSIHLPLSAALMVLMVVHIWFALKYR